ncbi:unnamed protein product [Linum trigynum]|uniref:Uncharacterized protein n=1 Tax=Linum trigynum TaxID=586398 RepID=A0AAV2CGN9_9ROSI
MEEGAIASWRQGANDDSKGLNQGLDDQKSPIFWDSSEFQMTPTAVEFPSIFHYHIWDAFVAAHGCRLFPALRSKLFEQGKPDVITNLHIYDLVSFSKDSISTQMKNRKLWLSVLVISGGILCTSGTSKWLGGNASLSTCFEDGVIFLEMECLGEQEEARKALVQVDQNHVCKIELCQNLAKVGELFEVATLGLYYWSLRYE